MNHWEGQAFQNGKFQVLSYAPSFTYGRQAGRQHQAHEFNVTIKQLNFPKQALED